MRNVGITAVRLEPHVAKMGDFLNCCHAYPVIPSVPSGFTGFDAADVEENAEPYRDKNEARIV